MYKGVSSKMSRQRECVKGQARKTKSFPQVCRLSVHWSQELVTRLGSWRGSKDGIRWLVLCPAGVGVPEAGLQAGCAM